LAALAGLAATPMLGSLLPERLGKFTRDQVSKVKLSAADWEVLEEYGVRLTERAVYVNMERRQFTADAFRFNDSEGGHAAYLWLGPLRFARSPLGETSDLGGVWGKRTRS
jgi:hypothetical protein